MAARVRALCGEERLFPPRARALVMVSGGQDSLTALHLLCSGVLGSAGPREVLALHVNHHLRGEESEADQALVERVCRALAVPLTVHDAPLTKSAGNVQERAREARRAAALRTAEAVAAHRIVLGHTLDDQVETLLYRLGRYGGLRALGAMPALDPPWARPLLRLRRVETAAYCRAVGLEFAVDRGNVDPGYVRTALRGRVVPAWEEALPGVVAAAGRAAEVAAETVALVEDVLREARRMAAASDGSFSAARLRNLPASVRRALLRSVLEVEGGRGVTRAGVLALEELLDRPGSATLDLGAGRRVVKEYDRLRIAAPPGDAPAEPGTSAGESGWSGSGEEVLLPLPGEACWGGLVVAAEETDGFRAHDPRCEAYLDRSAVTGPLTVRSARPGDRMHPLGSPGRRSLQDLFVDLRVPRALRNRIPLVVCGERILWVGGFALAEEGRIGPATCRAIRLVVRRGATLEL